MRKSRFGGRNVRDFLRSSGEWRCKFIWPRLCNLMGLIVYVTTRGVFGGRTKHNQKLVRQMDARACALVAAVFVATFLLPLLYVFTALLRFADYGMPAAVMWCGDAGHILVSKRVNRPVYRRWGGD